MPAGEELLLGAQKTLREKLQNYVVTSTVFLALLLLLGHLARQQSRWLRALHLPSSVLGGIIGWLIFALIELCGGDALTQAWFSIGWDVLPGFCTTIVFSCLFLGTPVPRIQQILKSPRREHLIYGLFLVFGQYAVASLLTGCIGLVDGSFNPTFATVLPYGYAGGPVVAEAMQDLYAKDSFNYPDGYPLSLLCATIGMFVGVISGATLVNLAPLAGARTTTYNNLDGDASDAQAAGGRQGPPPATRSLFRRVVRGVQSTMRDLNASASDSDHYAPAVRPMAGEQTVAVESLDSLMFHLCLVSVVMLLGYVLRIPFVAIEELFPQGSFLSKSKLLSVLPLFLFCLLGGLCFQAAIDRYATDPVTQKSFVDRETVNRISNTAQDILIVAAIARLGRNGLPPGVQGLSNFFSVVAESGLPLIVGCVLGLTWGIVCFWYIAPRMLPNFWAERALVEFGVSIGATSTGLLLLRMADPDGKTPVLTDFTFKQIFHVLITGGGFFDVMVPIPLCSVTGSAWPLLALSASIMACLLLIHPTVIRRHCKRGVARQRRTSTLPEVAPNAGLEPDTAVAAVPTGDTR